MTESLLCIGGLALSSLALFVVWCAARVGQVRTGRRDVLDGQTWEDDEE